MSTALHGRALQAGVAVAVAGILLALGYLALRDLPPSPERVTIALPVLPRTALVHVAVAKGFFAEEGLDVSILPVDYGVVALGHLRQGRADFGVAAEVPFVIAVMKGDSLGMVASLAGVSNDEAIIARRDRAIAAPRDLAGKKIGTTFGTSGSYFLWAFLIRHKLAPDSITLVNLSPDRIVAALADGSVDAVATWQPISLQAQAALGDNALSFADAGAYRSSVAMFGRGAFLKGHPGTVEKLVRALLKAERFMQSRPQETLDLVAAWLKIDVAELRPMWRHFDFRVDMLQSQLINLEDEARWAMERGYVARGPDPNFLPHLYLDALLAVRPDRVTVLR